MKNQEPIIITFDDSVWEKLKKALGVKNLKCKFCGKRITKRNIGGFLLLKNVFCRNEACLINAIQEEPLLIQNKKLFSSNFKTEANPLKTE